MRHLLLLALFTLPVFGIDWGLDNAHSSIRFKIKHMMISNVTGEFKKYDIEVKTDEKGVVKTVESTIDVDSIDTKNENRDNHLKAPDFFDATKHPKITFKSKTVKLNGEDITITGPLTMHGVTKDVTFKGTLSKVIKDPKGTEKRGLSVTTTIDRKAFGITWNKVMDGGGIALGEKVDVEVDAELEGKAAKI